MFSRAGNDDVSNIHRRWSFTRLGPSSFRASFSGSLVAGAILVAVSHLYYFESDALALFLPLSLGVLAALHFADYIVLRGTPVNKLSKVAHVSLFGNLLWMLTALLGIAADLVLTKVNVGDDLDYLVAGMLLAAGLRVGIFKSVFGAGLARAIPVSFLQPVGFFFAFIPVSSLGAVWASSAGLVFGTALFLFGVFWTVIADRAGRPVVTSTFGLLQAFIAAWTENDPGKIEEFTESRAEEENVETRIIRFIPSDKKAATAAIVLPDVHPGPFGTVGGSNLPHVLYQNF
ncbi:MAG: DUF2070 family protein, partial [Nitrososphaera sp.]|nr:DUF2070 family protein [Nitrososphaera sp.]